MHIFFTVLQLNLNSNIVMLFGYLITTAIAIVLNQIERNFSYGHSEKSTKDTKIMYCHRVRWGVDFYIRIHFGGVVQLFLIFPNNCVGLLKSRLGSDSLESRIIYAWLLDSHTRIWEIFDWRHMTEGMFLIFDKHLFSMFVKNEIFSSN